MGRAVDALLRRHRPAPPPSPLLDGNVVAIVGPVLAYLALYSALPHKELRFIFPALPVLTLGAASAVIKVLRAASICPTLLDRDGMLVCFVL